MLPPGQTLENKRFEAALEGAFFIEAIRLLQAIRNTLLACGEVFQKNGASFNQFKHNNIWLIG